MSHDEMDKLMDYLVQYADGDRRAIVEYILAGARNKDALRRVPVPAKFMQDISKGE